MNNPVIFARMPKQDVELLKKISRDRGEDLSDFVRRAVYKELASLSFLPDDQKKALGLLPGRQRMNRAPCDPEGSFHGRH